MAIHTSQSPSCPLSCDQTETSPRSLNSLRECWTTLYKITLPDLAARRSTVQPHWPVHLDHCFARIILDNAIGVDKPWTHVLEAPAVRNMSSRQFEDAIALAERIESGKVGLMDLNERSLALRGNKEKPVASADKEVRKRRAATAVENGDGTISKYFLPSPKKKARMSVSSPSTPAAVPAASVSASALPVNSAPDIDPSESLSSQTAGRDLTQTMTERKIAIFEQSDDTPPETLIADSKTMTTFRKTVLTLLCKVPKGHWTSYAAIADHITLCRATALPSTTAPTDVPSTITRGKLSQGQPTKCSPRAVGTALRNNPFAPLVPCHRVLAADGRIGGFGGSWGEDGKHAKEKKEILRREGVRFDGQGKVAGKAWRDWQGGVGCCVVV